METPQAEIVTESAVNLQSKGPGATLTPLSSRAHVRRWAPIDHSCGDALMTAAPVSRPRTFQFASTSRIDVFRGRSSELMLHDPNLCATPCITNLKFKSLDCDTELPREIIDTTNETTKVCELVIGKFRERLLSGSDVFQDCPGDEPLPFPGPNLH
jgi:hypothetical protein